MSSLNEDDGVTNEVRAGKALVAAAQRDRPALVALLAKYGAKKLPDLRLKDLQSFTRECEAIKEPVPPVELAPAFAIGELVRLNHFSTPSRVKGYELRYVISREGDDALQFGGNGIRADRLERLAPPETPPPAPAPTEYAEGLDGWRPLSSIDFGHIVERYTNKVKYFVSSSYNGTGHRVMTTLRGGVPKPDVPQNELVRDLGRTQAIPVSWFDFDELHRIGTALDDLKQARDIGESFTGDAKELLVQLEKAGFRVMRK